ncbi:zinc-binding dehydrogenase [Fulvivirgaceae bacterium BMA10]|uniref:Zinc-binding dehydrogenase n=1 Tax=Splendidivirga corallicola TaxID=3051826 RepID=A0ABT8KHU7_9BACT|nr:zinc-binding dehydrogenase [Fulvivirgaceae bacterium BMA10]
MIFLKPLSILGTTMGADPEFMAMLDFVNKYRIRPIIDFVFPMAGVQSAFDRMEENKHFGKIILSNSN